MNSHLAYQLRKTRLTELAGNFMEGCEQERTSPGRLRRAHTALRAWLASRV